MPVFFHTISIERSCDHAVAHALGVDEYIPLANPMIHRIGAFPSLRRVMQVVDDLFEPRIIVQRRQIFICFDLVRPAETGFGRTLRLPIASSDFPSRAAQARLYRGAFRRGQFKCDVEGIDRLLILMQSDARNPKAKGIYELVGLLAMQLRTASAACQSCFAL